MAIGRDYEWRRFGNHPYAIDIEFQTEEEALRHFQLLAKERSTRWDYLLQYLGYREELLNQELNAGAGERPKKVQMANLARGLVFSFVGLGILAIHFVVVLWAIEWLELGWMAYLIALGVSLSGAISTAFLLRGILKVFAKNEHDAHTVFMTYLAAFILIVSMVSSFGLGKFRAELVKMKLHEADSPVILQGELVEDGSKTDPTSRFYEKTLPLLGLIFPLLAVLFDISSGILLHVDLDKLVSSAIVLGLLRERERLHQMKVEMATARDTIGEEPERRLAEWQNLKRIKTEQAKKQEEKRAYRSSSAFRRKRFAIGLAPFIGFTLVCLILATRGWPDTVVELDLSLSEKKAGVTGSNALEANKKAVVHIIGSLGPGETFYVVGITGTSRVDPLVLLKARLREKPGYFSENLERDRAVILASWTKTARKLELFARETDIAGALELAGQLLHGSRDKTLYVLSDGKNCTRALNLERPPKKDGDFAKKLKSITTFPDLKGVDVYWLGAGGPGTTNLHLESLEHFWRGFIERSGGTLKQFTSLREVQK